MQLGARQHANAAILWEILRIRNEESYKDPFKDPFMRHDSIIAQSSSQATPTL